MNKPKVLALELDPLELASAGLATSRFLDKLAQKVIDEKLESTETPISVEISSVEAIAITRLLDFTYQIVNGGFGPEADKQAEVARAMGFQRP
jgi:hypothetical protein